MMQVPALWKLTLEPESEHTSAAEASMLSATGKPDVDDAATS